MNVMEMVLLKKREDLGRIYDMIEISHKNNLFLSLESLLQKCAEVAKKQHSRTIRKILVEKVSMLLGV